MDQYTCGVCSETLTDIVAFLRHKVKHVDGSRGTSCLLCGLSFSRQISLTEHLHRKHLIPGVQEDGHRQPASGRRRGRPPKKQATFPEKISGLGSEDGIGTLDRLSDARHVGVVDAGDTILVNSTKGDNTELYQEAADVSVSAPAPETMHVIIEGVKDSTIASAFPQMNVQSYPASKPDPTGDSCILLESSVVSTLGDIHHTPHSTPAVDHGPGQAHQVHLRSSQLEDAQNLHKVNGTTVFDTVTCSTAPQANIPAALNSDNDVRTSSDEMVSSSGASVMPETVNAVPSSVGQVLDHEGSAADFLFVLLSKNFKGSAFSYNKLSFKCFHCDFRTTWRKCLVKHMQEKHPDMLAIHQCISIQNPETADQQQIMKMSEYVSMHAQQRKLAKSKRIRSVENQDLPGTFACNKCDKTFGRLRYLRQHQNTHRVDRKHLCDLCGKAFKAKCYLVAHRRTHKVKSYSCSQCDFTSTVNSLIHAHRQLHSEGCVLCDICGAAYNDRTTLKKHKLVHDPSRPHQCTYPGCTWRFLNEAMCRAHFRAHTIPGRFTCSECSYVFRHKHHLQRHLMKIHGMEKATVYNMTSGRPHHQTEERPPADPSEGKQVAAVYKAEEEQPIQETVNVIMNSDFTSEELQTMLETGQLVIATDSTDNTNYEVDITMGVDCHTLTEHEEAGVSGQTILIPHTAECSQIILHQEPDAVPADVET